MATTTTWRALGTKGSEAATSSRFWWRYQKDWKGPTFRPTATSEWKLESFFSLMRKQRSCVLMPQMLRVSGWAPGTATTAAQYQLLPLPAASLSWNQLRSWHARPGDWEEHTSTAGSFSQGTMLPHATTVAARSECVWAVNACSETPGNNAAPNSQINRIHSPCGISFWMADCCTSLGCIWEGEQGIKQTNMSAQLESQVVPSAIRITMETAKYTISTPVCSSSIYCTPAHVRNCKLGIFIYIINTIWSSCISDFITGVCIQQQVGARAQWWREPVWRRSGC